VGRGVELLEKAQVVTGPTSREFLGLSQKPKLLAGSAMNRRFAFWTAFISAFIASGLALRVAFRLGLAAHVGGQSFIAELDTQSRVAAVAALAALVSAIAQVIQKAPK
jgi:hypothetical protein